MCVLLPERRWDETFFSSSFSFIHSFLVSILNLIPLSSVTNTKCIKNHQELLYIMFDAICGLYELDTKCRRLENRISHNILLPYTHTHSCTLLKSFSLIFFFLFVIVKIILLALVYTFINDDTTFNFNSFSRYSFSQFSSTLREMCSARFVCVCVCVACQILLQSWHVYFDGQFSHDRPSVMVDQFLATKRIIFWVCVVAVRLHTRFNYCDEGREKGENAKMRETKTTHPEFVCDSHLDASPNQHFVSISMCLSVISFHLTPVTKLIYINFLT